MAKDAKTVREELARPFAPEDLEWRIQVTSKDKTSGLRIGLPVRGQSTKNNARTRKGRKKTVANKKKATK